MCTAYAGRSLPHASDDQNRLVFLDWLHNCDQVEIAIAITDACRKSMLLSKEKIREKQQTRASIPYVDVDIIL